MGSPLVLLVLGSTFGVPVYMPHANTRFVRLFSRSNLSSATGICPLSGSNGGSNE